jgi:general secretion pathway protein K
VSARARGVAARRTQRGVALAIVLWFVAGMSMLVAGIVMNARTDARLATVHLARAQVSAAGDGAINLLLADIVDGRLAASADRGALPQGRYAMGEEYLSVVAVPESILVSVNSASVQELAELLRLTGAATGDGGRAMAMAVVQFRDAGGALGGGRYRSIEDLLRVPRMNRAAVDALRDYVSAADAVGGGARLTRASLSRLTALTPAARARRESMLAPGNGGVDASGSGTYRVDALLRRGQDVWLRRRWVTLGGGRDGLPWQFTRTEPVRMVARSTARGA